MRPSIFFTINLILTLLSTTLINFVNAQCNNGNAENGDFTNWSGAYSIRTVNGINLSAMTNGIDPQYHNVTNVGFDSNVGGNLLPTVGVKSCI